MKKCEKNNQSCLEWIQLIISFSIPVILAIYTVLDNNRDLAIAAHNRAQDLQIADNQQKNTILREYQKTLSKLIEKYGSKFNESSSISLVARFATLSAMNQLDPIRRSFLIRLLYDAELINYQLISDQPAISLESANLIELCLIDGTIGQSLFHITMESAIMTKANFYNINMHGAIFNKAILNNANFSFTTNGWWCSDMDCSGNTSASLYFESSDLTFTTFEQANYHNVSFYEAKMGNTNLYLFRCEACFFDLANMTQINLQNVEIENSSFGLVTLTDSTIYGSNFHRNVDFSSADMSNVNMVYSNFTGCQFISTQLRNSKFEYNIFVNSSFIGAKMNRILILHNIFINVNFTSADISESTWRYVSCERCIFNFVNFNGTDLSHSRFIDSDFQKSIISDDQLNQIASLDGSILPNGTVINNT